MFILFLSVITMDSLLLEYYKDLIEFFYTESEKEISLVSEEQKFDYDKFKASSEAAQRSFWEEQIAKARKPKL
jgi:hypothetical protein